MIKILKTIILTIVTIIIMTNANAYHVKEIYGFIPKNVPIAIYSKNHKFPDSYNVPHITFVDNSKKNKGWFDRLEKTIDLSGILAIRDNKDSKFYDGTLYIRTSPEIDKNASMIGAIFNSSHYDGLHVKATYTHFSGEELLEFLKKDKTISKSDFVINIRKNDTDAMSLIPTRDIPIYLSLTYDAS